MRRYWPTVPVGSMLVREWDFMRAPAAGDFGPTGTPIRTQQFMQLNGAPANEYVLVDHFTRPHWTHATWIDTWHIRYDGETVVEFKDDANLRAFTTPPTDGIEFNRSLFDPGMELRWGNVLQADVSNPSPTVGWATQFVASAGSLMMTGSFRLRADNSFMLVEVRDDVIVGGTRYDDVAVVRVDQRACASPTSCAADAAGTAQYDINYFYLAVDQGAIVNFGYHAAYVDGALVTTLSFGEALLRVCTLPVPEPAPMYDWQIAYDATLTDSPTPPSCP
jgi:hypothetical protein